VAKRAEQVGSTDIAYQHCVTGEYAVRHAVAGVLVADDADRLGRMARRGEDLGRDLAE
jgi:hypothetical protein